MAFNFLAAGIGLLVDRNGFENFIDEVLNNTPIAYTMAIHNIWTDALAAIVSFIGWAMLVEGVLMLALRRPFLQIVGKILFTAAMAIPVGTGTIMFGVALLAAAIT